MPRTLVAPLAGLVILALGSCSSGQPDAEDISGESLADDADGGPIANVVIVGGEDGVAVTDGHRLEPIEGMVGTPFLQQGPLAVPVAHTAAAVIGQGQIAIVGAEGDAHIVDCAGCAGLAATDRYVVTTRKNFQPGEGFDILVFTPTLELEQTIAARRHQERRGVEHPAENTESAVTLAASEDRITVGYLSAVGGARAGPSVVAQYSYEGELLDSVLIDGLLGQAAVSPDGEFLAVGVGGSGGACITTSELAVIALDNLEVLDVGPSVPLEVSADFRGLDEPWFLMTDVFWDESTVLATGEVFLYGNELDASGLTDGTCEEPDVWVRTFDTATGDFNDVQQGEIRAQRWIGPECEDVLQVVGSFPEATLVARVGGEELPLGSYSKLALGGQPPPHC